MFADETNTKCEQFVSRVPSRRALAVNAFGDPTLWRDRSLLWCVPPPSLLSQTLAWMRGTRAKGILGLPYWTSHPVFPSLFPPSSTPPFLKDYIMFPERNHIITPSFGAKAPATMRVYEGSMKRLRVFAREKGIDPSCPSSLLIFRRIHERRSLSSLKILHSAYSHFCDPLPPFFANMLSSLFNCTRRSHTVTHHPKVPSSHIHTIVRFASLHPTDFQIVRCALGAALAYGALLNLSWSEGLLRISIRKAKNDQFSEGKETFISIGEESETLRESKIDRKFPFPYGCFPPYLIPFPISPLILSVKISTPSVPEWASRNSRHIN
ncbi:hypothetical protein PRIPAC_86380 [Pristionchus pacificus]|uniref:Uncharacterized protein n=1 Tax=Pristionchus pacificus TaxID=54126 RepID=A0A2A6BN46_PRIPA|nr:hypothetical protein PRIPAC_86380 [Pristionchus pacificus]|eukprot:PDM67213.1 hypothetical protein PRIPAC_48630 [Pristionchus pacificus]